MRQKGGRRAGLPADFPLRDCDGVLVQKDRRHLADRRKPVHDIDDLRVILSKMGSD